MKPPSRLGAAIAAALLVATTLLVSTLLRSPLPLLPLLPCLPAVTAPSGSGYEPAGLAALADAAVYYATTPTVPQQSRAEIALSLAVLPPPCAGAAAGVRPRPRLAALARAQPRRHHRVPGGGPQVVPRRALASRRSCVPTSSATARGSTRPTTSSNPTGGPPLLRPWRRRRARRPGQRGVPLALHDLPPEVYESEWDMIMLDAPRDLEVNVKGEPARYVSED
ncbi:hypothetical protein ACQ4PT_014476 [Festuca glaucescens]